MVHNWALTALSPPFTLLMTKILFAVWLSNAKLPLIHPEPARRQYGNTSAYLQASRSLAASWDACTLPFAQ